MNLTNIVCFLVFQRYCLGAENVKVSVGFLFEGEAKNLPPSSKVDMFFYVKKRGGSFSMKPTNLYSKHGYNNEQEGDVFTFKHVGSDSKKKHWANDLKSLSIYSEIRLQQNKDHILIPGLFTGGEEHSGQLKTHIDFFEQMFDETCGVLKCLYNYKMIREPELYVTRYEKYRNIKTPDNEKKISREGEFDARKVLLKFLNKINAIKDTKPKDETGDYRHYERRFKKVWRSKNLRKAIGIKKKASAYNMEEIKIYTQRCFDIYNEIGKFYDFECKKLCALPGNAKITMRTKKIAYFMINFPAKQIAPEILIEDLRFYSEKDDLISIDPKYIHILDDRNRNYNLVVIESDIILEKGVNKMTIDRFQIEVPNILSELS